MKFTIWCVGDVC